MAGETAYRRLIRLLDEGGARYTLMDHPRAGQDDMASHCRGNPTPATANGMNIRIRLRTNEERHLLAVMPGDQMMEINALRRLFGATHAAFETPGPQREPLVPFSFEHGRTLVVERRLLTPDRLYFLAGRLDRSVALRTDDYVVLARPLIARFAARRYTSASLP